jgi:endonuclease III
VSRLSRLTAEPALPDRRLHTSLRRKALRVSRILEKILGTPSQVRSLPQPLDMLIATILSQNTNDKNSHRAYTQLRKRYHTWSEVAAAPARSIASAIRSGGMANQKSVRIKETLAFIKKQFGSYSLATLSQMQNEEVVENLTAIKGVGVKTASCVLLFSMRRDVFPVDTHVHRICGRLGLSPGCGTPEKTFHFMQSVFPRGKGYSFHTNLIRFGRRICRSAKPLCGMCPLYDECSFEHKSHRPLRTAGASSVNHDFMLLDNVGTTR